MPPDSDAAQTKKARKKPRPPQAISQETWKAVEAAICIGGLGYSEAGRKFGIEPHAIMAKARRGAWPVPSVIQKRVEALQRGRFKTAERYKEARGGNEEAIEIAAESWAQKAERHRVLAFDFAHSALKAAAKTPPPIESWRDVDLADRCARRNAGLDSEEGSRISIGMALINDRLEVLAETLPKEVD
jgi:hypothetical protein